MSFGGFTAEAFAWFAGIEANNNREWFVAHRDTYERAVRDPLDELLESFADELGGRVKLFRQHRDVRFSRDKSPYKTRTYGVVRDRPNGLAPLYMSLAAEGLFVGTGYYQLEPDQLARFRDAVVDEKAGSKLERVVAAVRAAGVETFGEALKTAPRGYPKDHPRAALLRHRSLFAGRRLDRKAKGIGRQAAVNHVRRTWEACAPLNAWLDEHVGAATEGTRPRR